MVEGEDEENSIIPHGAVFDHDVLYQQYQETIDCFQSGKWIDKMMQTPRDKDSCNPCMPLSNMVFITIAYVIENASKSTRQVHSKKVYNVHGEST